MIFKRHDCFPDIIWPYAPPGKAREMISPTTKSHSPYATAVSLFLFKVAFDIIKSVEREKEQMEMINVD